MYQSTHLSRYPQYQFLTDVGISSKAQNQNTRYDLESLYGVTFDVSTLSMSDYLVCCFSSQVRMWGCRNEVKVGLVYW